MKRLTCEMCGSTNLIKQNGVFVCQDCGTKYSVEDAKKMMTEEDAEISASTDKVDTVDSIESYYKMAENAYASNNREEAEGYCNKIIEIDPDNYKAWLLKGQAVGWQTTLANIRLEEAVNCFLKAVDKASEEERESVEKKTLSEFYVISDALVKLCCENYAKNPSVQNADKIINVFGIITNSVHAMDEFAFALNRALMPGLVTHVIATTIAGYELRIREDYWEAPNYPSKFELDNYANRCLGALRLLNLVIKLCDTDKLVLGPEELIIKAYECKIHILKELAVSVGFERKVEGGYTKYKLEDKEKQKIAYAIMECQRKIKEIDPDYQIPLESKSSSKGCYIATAVYGSYDCPQVWTLRRYRDNHLALTWYGRAFIYTYYAISPTIVKWFGHTEWFKNMWRRKLDRMVKSLQDKGYESTPYQDRDWR